MSGSGSRGSRGEDIIAGLPVIGPLSGARTRDDRALIRKQEQMAQDAARRQKMMEQARMNAMNQRIGAFAPRNAVMAQMFGPDAAFTGEQIADMTANPMPKEYGVNPAHPYTQQRDAQGNLSFQNLSWQEVKDLADRTGRDRTQVFNEWHEAKRKAADEAAERDRRAKIGQQFATPAQDPGGAAFRPVQAAPARSY